MFAISWPAFVILLNKFPKISLSLSLHVSSFGHLLLSFRRPLLQTHLSCKQLLFFFGSWWCSPTSVFQSQTYFLLSHILYFVLRTVSVGVGWIYSNKWRQRAERVGGSTTHNAENINTIIDRHFPPRLACLWNKWQKVLPSNNLEEKNTKRKTQLPPNNGITRLRTRGRGRATSQLERTKAKKIFQTGNYQRLNDRSNIQVNGLEPMFDLINQPLQHCQMCRSGKRY